MLDMGDIRGIVYFTHLIYFIMHVIYLKLVTVAFLETNIGEIIIIIKSSCDVS